MTPPAADLPMDAHNQNLLQNIRPMSWVNPKSEGCYQWVVLGAGTAGLVAAAGAAGLGARVALIERRMMGGDCLVSGCVPSKAFIASAKAAQAVRNAAEFGISVEAPTQIRFDAVTERMRRLRAELSPHDSAARFKSLGVDIFFGQGRFIDRGAIEVEGQILRYKKALIATGSRPKIPDIPGMAEAGYLTNETVFNLRALPRRLAVIGGGPIGCELAQAFRRFGCEVLLIHNHDRLLNRDDSDAAELLAKVLMQEGIRCILGARVHEVRRGTGRKLLAFESGGLRQEWEADEVLVSAGRVPNVQDMNLEAAGIQYDEQTGIHVNARLQTAERHIYASGDVCLAHKFTHLADFSSRLAIRNALFGGRRRWDETRAPHCIFTDPEIAQVGLTEAEAGRRQIPVQCFTRKMSQVDRAILEGERDGFVKIVTRAGTDQILGATIAASHAGEMINEVTLAMANGIGLSKLASVIHPYPTQADAIQKIGDDYQRSRLTPFVKKALSVWLSWTR